MRALLCHLSFQVSAGDVCEKRSKYSKSDSKGLKPWRVTISHPNRTRTLPACCRGPPKAKLECFGVVSNCRLFPQENTPVQLRPFWLLNFKHHNTKQVCFEICYQSCNNSSVPLTQVQASVVIYYTYFLRRITWRVSPFSHFLSPKSKNIATKNKITFACPLSWEDPRLLF